jgi:uroporphyrinogen III methyltransferase/synthase
MTLRGVEVLGEADVVLYDYLVNPGTLEHAAPGAELVPLGRPHCGRTMTPEEITDRMVAEARAGRTVVRLKGGDPSVFGRGADETGALGDAGVPYEVVPGITSGLAVAAYSEIPVTQQDDASCVALVAAHERTSKEERGQSCLDFAALAAFPGTLVFYMGVGRVKAWSGALIEHGRAADTPVAVVRWCTRADQETVRCTLGTVADVVAERRLKPPAVFVVGDVVARAPERSWFAARPLSGVRVLVPGSPATSRGLRGRLAGLGAEVVLSPVVRITAPEDWASLDASLDALSTYDWVVFSSANGVDALMGRLLARGEDARRLGGTRLAAMGSGTADRLAHYRLHADLVPDSFDAEALARALLGETVGQSFLLVRASRGRNVLAEALLAAGSRVDSVVAYGSEDVETPDAAVVEALAAGEIHWITVTSAAIARSLARLYGPALEGVRFASIGPVTSEALRALGHEPAVEASPHTTSALVDAILEGGGTER